MSRRAVLSLIAAACLAIVGPGQASAEPPATGTALDEIFPDGLPFPFERVIERLRAEAGPDAVRSALIPLGRSVQRHAAAPDYFGSPRIVVAVSGDRARGPEMARLADRLYLGYVPAAAVIEAISYDEAAGRFEFQEIVGYGIDDAARTGAADRSICLRCHQGEGPIFARPLWSETNANPAVAARLEALGPTFRGVPVRQAIDEPGAFDASTDRAARIAVANRIWAEGCPDAGCRAETFAAALRFGLNGARAGWTAAEAGASGLDERARELWPDGLAIVSPDLPNRDPAAMLAADDPGSLLETTGALNPETPRPMLVPWRPDAGAFAAAAREIAAMLSPGDFEWLDALLRSRRAEGQRIALGCTVSKAAAGADQESRFECSGGDSRIKGFLRADGTGRIDRLTVRGSDAPARTQVRWRNVDGAARIDAVGAAPRLPDGARVDSLVLAGAEMSLEVMDDFSPVAAALQSGAEEGGPFGPGPFRRRALLMLVADVVGGENG